MKTESGERNDRWSQARTLVNLNQNTKSTRLVRGEGGSKRVKLNINNNTPKTIKATGVLLKNRTDKETFSFWEFNVETESCYNSNTVVRAVGNVTVR